MTIDEIIKHQIDMAKLNENRAERWKEQGDNEAAKLNNRLAADHRQLAEWLTELKEAKRLLKSAVEDMKDIVSSDSGCRCCEGEEAASCAYIKCWTWRYADRALALIGEEGGNNA